MGYFDGGERMNTVEMARQMRPIVEQAVQSLDDNSALQVVPLYPKWAAGVEYEADRRLQHGGKLWQVRQKHTSQSGWEPGSVGTESLFAEVCETHTGTLDDPIPYDGNMELVEGKYYSQNGVTYLCTRSTGQPVYNSLADLVRLYVKIV